MSKVIHLWEDCPCPDPDCEAMCCINCDAVIGDPEAPQPEPYCDGEDEDQ